MREPLVMKTLAIAIVGLILPIVSATPVVYYANLGDTAQLQCGGGSMACYSTYADKTIAFSMVMLTPSFKYQVQSGMIAINNVQATDAGFYTCASRCDQVTYDQIAYYLHPTSKFRQVRVIKRFKDFKAMNHRI